MTINTLHALVIIGCEEVFREPGIAPGVHLFATREEAAQFAVGMLVANGEIEIDDERYIVVDYDTPTLCHAICHDAADALKAWSDRFLHPGEVCELMAVRNVSDFQHHEAFKLIAKPQQDDSTADDILAAFNAAFGCRMRMTPGRRKHIRTRLRDRWWREAWRGALQHAKGLPFFNDRSGPWRPNIDWFIRPDTVTKIVEGRYDEAHTYKQQHEFHGKAAAREASNADAFRLFERGVESVTGSSQNVSDDRGSTEAALRVSFDGRTDAFRS